MMNNIISCDKISHKYITFETGDTIGEKLKYLFRRKYIHIDSLKNIDLKIDQGTCLGLLGANGAGKTTFIKIVSGLLHPTLGDINVLGYTPYERKTKFKELIAVAFGNRSQLHWELSPMDSWLLVGTAYGMSSIKIKEKAENLSKYLDVFHKTRVPLRKLSLGERMKCELIACVLHEPKLLLLDEPTLGLDLSSQQAIRFAIRSWIKMGLSVIITSHYMKDIEETSDKIAILKKGEITYSGSIKNLISSYSRGLVVEFATEDLSFPQQFGFKKIENGSWKGIFDGNIVSLLKKISDNGIDKLKSISIREQNLEEVFLGIINEDDTIRNNIGD